MKRKKIALGIAVGVLVTLLLVSNFSKWPQRMIMLGVGFGYTLITCIVAHGIRLELFFLWFFFSIQLATYLYRPEPVHQLLPSGEKMSVTLLSAKNNERRQLALDWMEREGISGDIYSKKFIGAVDEYDYSCINNTVVDVGDVEYLIHFRNLLLSKRNQQEKWFLFLEDDVESATSYPFLYYTYRYIDLHPNVDFIWLDNRASLQSTLVGGGLVGCLIRRDSIDKIVWFLSQDPCPWVNGKGISTDSILMYLCTTNMLNCKAAPLLRERGSTSELRRLRKRTLGRIMLAE